MRTTRLFIGLSALLLLVACGSQTPESSDGDPLFELGASDGATKELGVVAWRGTSARAGASTVRGLDAAGATVFQLDTTSTSTPDGTHVVQRVSRGAESASVELVPTRKNGEVYLAITNGLTSPALRRGVVRMLADLSADRGGPATSTLLTPQDEGANQQELVKKCGYLVRCNTPPIVACTGGFVGVGIQCPTHLVEAAKDFLVNGLGFGSSDPADAAKDTLAECGKSVKNAVDACDTTQSTRTGCEYGGTNGCPDVDAGAPDQSCSPPCDAVHSCIAMAPGDYSVPVTNGHGCLAN